MSEYENIENGDNFQLNQYDTSIIFLRDNKYTTEPYNNTGYAAVTLTAGTVVGRIAATNYIVPVNAGASDGSQFPIGLIAQNVTVAASSSKNVPICTEGEVAEEKINFDDVDDTLDTIVSDIRYKDRLKGIGIVPIAGTELSAYDNA